MNAHPDLFTESTLSTNLGVKLIGSPIIVSSMDSLSITCDYMKFAIDPNGNHSIAFYEKGQVKYNHPLPKKTFFLTLSQEGELISQSPSGAQVIYTKETLNRYSIKPDKGNDSQAMSFA
jgi:hypothetical protein